MRLFAAVDPDPTARAAAARTVRALASRLEGEASRRIRWVPPEQLHVTLRFLGESTEADADAVRGVFRPPFVTGAFTARMSGLDRFPASGTPRVVWLGLDEGRDAMVAVRAELDRRLASAGCPPESRAFRAHLTLGRTKRWAAWKRYDLVRAWSEVRPETPRWVVDHVTLYESRLTPRGARHHVLESAPLRRFAGA